MSDAVYDIVYRQVAEKADRMGLYPFTGDAAARKSFEDYANAIIAVANAPRITRETIAALRLARGNAFGLSAEPRVEHKIVALKSLNDAILRAQECGALPIDVPPRFLEETNQVLGNYHSEGNFADFERQLIQSAKTARANTTQTEIR